MTEDTHRKDQTAADQAGVDESRREALVKMGRFAGYTAPAMLVLLGATKARAHARGSGTRDGDTDKDHFWSWRRVRYRRRRHSRYGRHW